MKMTVCYLRNDSETDAEQCRISLRGKSPITLFAQDSDGRVVCLTGVVLSIRFGSNRPVGMRWRVEIDVLTVAARDALKRSSPRD